MLETSRPRSSIVTINKNHLTSVARELAKVVETMRPRAKPIRPATTTGFPRRLVFIVSSDFGLGSIECGWQYFHFTVFFSTITIFSKVFSLSITIADSRVSTISGKQLLYSHYCFAGVTISQKICSITTF